MPLVDANNDTRPSTIASVIRQVAHAFDAMGDSTPIMVGKQYLVEGAGSPPHVIFVPEPKGKIGPPIEMGNACSVTHSCDVYVRGTIETQDDLTRFDKTYELLDRVCALISVAGTGRVEWGDVSDGSPTDVDSLGAELAFSFTYKRDVRHDAARWSLPAASTDSTGPLPVPPPGSPASVNSVVVTTTPPA